MTIVYEVFLNLETIKHQSRVVLYLEGFQLSLCDTNVGHMSHAVREESL